MRLIEATTKKLARLSVCCLASMATYVFVFMVTMRALIHHSGREAFRNDGGRVANNSKKRKVIFNSDLAGLNVA